MKRFVEFILLSLNQWLCSCREEHSVLQVEGNRLYVVCQVCGRESNGIDLSKHPGLIVASRLPEE